MGQKEEAIPRPNVITRLLGRGFALDQTIPTEIMVHFLRDSGEIDEDESAVHGISLTQVNFSSLRRRSASTTT